MNRDPSAFDNLTDAALVAASLTGDKVAFGRIVTRHWPRVHRVAGRCLPTAFEVDDVAQEAFLQAYLSLTKLRDAQHVGAWVCGIAANLARMRLRSQKAVARLGDWEIGEFDSAETITIRNEQLRHLHDAIDKLPPAEQAAIWHVYRDGMSLRETAAKLAISLSAAKVRVHRGRQRLRHQLKEQVPMIPVTISDQLQWIIHGETYAREDAEIYTLSMQEAADRIAQSTRPIREFEKTSYALGSGQRTIVIFLTEQNGERRLPMFVGAAEGDLIAQELCESPEGLYAGRPRTLDLMQRIIETAEVTIDKLTISSLQEHVFIGTLTLIRNGQATELDCRPSDGLALSAKLKFPLFVAPAVMDAAESNRIIQPTK